MSIEDKLQHMLDILKEDKEYTVEYKQFVENFSYAKDDLIPDFNTAVAAVNQLVQNVIR